MYRWQSWHNNILAHSMIASHICYMPAVKMSNTLTWSDNIDMVKNKVSKTLVLYLTYVTVYLKQLSYNCFILLLILIFNTVLLIGLLK